MSNLKANGQFIASKFIEGSMNTQIRVVSTSNANGISNTAIISYPSGINSGDLIVIGLTSNGSAAFWSTPSGWTASSILKNLIYYTKVASGSESGTVSIPRIGIANVDWVSICASIRNANTTIQSSNIKSYETTAYSIPAPPVGSPILVFPAQVSLDIPTNFVITLSSLVSTNTGISLTANAPITMTEAIESKSNQSIIALSTVRNTSNFISANTFSSGTGTVIAPLGATQATVVVIGGGGGGGRNAGTAGGGGGAGAFVVQSFPVTGGSTSFTYTVGTGGAGRTATTGSGTAGVASTVTGGATLTANGGAGGTSTLGGAGAVINTSQSTIFPSSNGTAGLDGASGGFGGECLMASQWFYSLSNIAGYGGSGGNNSNGTPGANGLVNFYWSAYSANVTMDIQSGMDAVEGASIVLAENTGIPEFYPVSVANVVLQSGAVPANGIIQIPFPTNIVANDELLLFIQREGTSGGTFGGFGTSQLTTQGFTDYSTSITRYNTSVINKSIDIFTKTATGSETGFIQANASTIPASAAYCMGCIHLKNTSSTIVSANSIHIGSNGNPSVTTWINALTPPVKLSAKNEKIVTVVVVETGTNTGNLNIQMPSNYVEHGNVNRTCVIGGGNIAMGIFSSNSVTPYITSNTFTSGSGIVVAPEGATSATILAWGGGGGAAWGSLNASFPTSSGAGAGFTIKTVPVNGGSTIFSYSIGAGGTGGGNPGAVDVKGTNGGNTSVTGGGVNMLSTGGGGGGQNVNGIGFGGTYGNTSGGDYGSSSGMMGQSYDATSATKVGGAAGGSGEVANTGRYGGGGTSSATGSSYGGGGASTTTYAYDGASGAVIFLWNSTTPNTYVTKSDLNPVMQTVFSFVYSSNSNPKSTTVASYYGNTAFRATSLAESTTAAGKLYANGQMQVTEFVEQ